MSSGARRRVAAALSLTLFVVACGGSADQADVVAAQAEPVAAQPTTAPIEAATTAPETSTAQPAPAATAPPTAAEPEATEVPQPAEVALVLPAVEVIDLTNDEMADLASFSRPGPTLLWFWAPH